MRPAPSRARVRLTVAAAVVLGLGLLFWFYSAYHVLEAGGLTTTSLRGACARAATGTVDVLYRTNETVAVEHTFVPPTATCRWSGGSSAVLVPGTWTWTGIVLTGVGLVGVIALRLTAATASGSPAAPRVRR